jgi:hypothetical protein
VRVCVFASLTWNTTRPPPPRLACHPMTDMHWCFYKWDSSPPPFKALYSVIRVLCCVFFCRRRASYIRRGGGRFIPNIRTRKSMRERESIHQAGRKWQTVRRQSMWEGPCYRSGKCVCVQVVQSAAVHPPCIYPTPTTAVLLEHTKERPAQLKAVDQRIRVTLHVETTPYVTYQMLVSVW